MSQYRAFKVEVIGKVAQVTMSRADKLNAMNADMWAEFIQIFDWIEQTDAIRAVVIAGAGKHFCAGIDLQMLAQAGASASTDVGRKAEHLRKQILQLQASFNAVDNCRKPVLAAVQGYCLGAGIDLISACDMRYASADAQFSIKEIDMGMAADVGTLQRLPRLVGDGIMRELAYTGRMVDASEAQQIGLVNRVYADSEQLQEGVLLLAQQIAEKSPVAIRGTKQMIRYMRDHSVADGLEYIATWNAAMLQSADLRIAMTAHMNKEKPEFAD